jgi:3',5'-nucleoside bisphosphate phosphatase
LDLDLHLHSTASDGTASPSEVVSYAVEARLDVIALTDHDTVQGVPEALRAAEGHPIQVIPGIEVSCSHEDSEIHVLGYFVDASDETLLSQTGEAGRRREERMAGMVRNLQEDGFEVSMAQVRRIAGSDETTLARPHLARALAESGYVDAPREAFDRFIGNEHKAYIPTRLQSVERGIEMIRSAGGIAIWAHPQEDRVEAFLPAMVEAGLAGVEIYRPRTPNRKIRLLERMARTYDLLATGGSDWHGLDQGPLGEFRVRAREIERFLEVGGL